MNPRSLLALASAALLTAAVSAQTAGRMDTLRGCSHPGPTNSLRGSLVQPTVWTADSSDFFAIEMESIGTVGQWAVHADPAKPGFSGTGYLEWTGPDYPTQPGNGTIAYRVFVTNPGNYQIRIHNRHDGAIVKEDNDAWMRINGGSWFRSYSNDGSNNNVWNWDFRMSPRNIQVEQFLARGINTIELSAMSANFKLDRMHVFRTRTFPFADLTLPLSELQRSRPVRGGLLSVELGDPNHEAGLPAGTTQTVLVGSLFPASNAPCGVGLPGFGPQGGTGEFLLAFNPVPFALTTVALPWNGPGNPARYDLPVPNDAAIVGFQMYLQGVLADLSAPRAVLTDGAKLTFGDF